MRSIIWVSLKLIDRLPKSTASVSKRQSMLAKPTPKEVGEAATGMLPPVQHYTIVSQSTRVPLIKRTT